jgi:hypothetical protein
LNGDGLIVSAAGATQTPLEHSWPVVHAVAHVPQWLAVVCRLVSHPFDATLSQSPKPTLHAPTAHAEALQTDVAFGRLQTVPQVPQLLTLFVVFTSHPLPGA